MVVGEAATLPYVPPGWSMVVGEAVTPLEVPSPALKRFFECEELGTNHEAL